MTAHSSHGLYWAWCDPNPRKPAAVKLTEAVNRYTAKFKHEPTLALVNPLDMDAACVGVDVLLDSDVPRHTYWLTTSELAATGEPPRVPLNPPPPSDTAALAAVRGTGAALLLAAGRRGEERA